MMNVGKTITHTLSVCQMFNNYEKGNGERNDRFNQLRKSLIRLT